MATEPAERLETAQGSERAAWVSLSTASLFVALRGVFPGIRVATGHVLRSAAVKVSAECKFCAQRSVLRRCYRKAVTLFPIGSMCRLRQLGRRTPQRRQQGNKLTVHSLGIRMSVCRREVDMKRLQFANHL